MAVWHYFGRRGAEICGAQRSDERFGRLKASWMVVTFESRVLGSSTRSPLPVPDTMPLVLYPTTSLPSSSPPTIPMILLLFIRPRRRLTRPPLILARRVLPRRSPTLLQVPPRGSTFVPRASAPSPLVATSPDTPACTPASATINVLSLAAKHGAPGRITCNSSKSPPYLTSSLCLAPGFCHFDGRRSTFHCIRRPPHAGLSRALFHA